MSKAPKLTISPQVGEMAGRPEGGAKERSGDKFASVRSPPINV
jgi:hypothetical protein